MSKSHHRPAPASRPEEGPAGLLPPEAAPDAHAETMPADPAPSPAAPPAPRCEKHDVPCVIGSKTSNYTEWRCPAPGCKIFHRRLPANLERALSRGRRRK